MGCAHSATPADDRADAYSVRPFVHAPHDPDCEHDDAQSVELFADGADLNSIGRAPSATGWSCLEPTPRDCAVRELRMRRLAQYHGVTADADQYSEAAAVLDAATLSRFMLHAARVSTWIDAIEPADEPDPTLSQLPCCDPLTISEMDEMVWLCGEQGASVSLSASPLGVSIASPLAMSLASPMVPTESAHPCIPTSE